VKMENQHTVSDAHCSPPHVLEGCRLSLPLMHLAAPRVSNQIGFTKHYGATGVHSLWRTRLEVTLVEGTLPVVRAERMMPEQSQLPARKPRNGNGLPL